MFENSLIALSVVGVLKIVFDMVTGFISCLRGNFGMSCIIVILLFMIYKLISYTIKKMEAKHC